jgi:hypothetical protein
MADSPQPPQHVDLSRLAWDEMGLEASLQSVYDHTLAEARALQGWYQRDTKHKGFWAKNLRLVAVVATSIGGAIPMLAQVIKLPVIGPIDPIWSTIMIAVGAAALGLDRFFGFSSGWIRSMTASLNIEAWLKEYEYDWALQRSMLAGSRPTPAQAQMMIQKSTAFTAKISATVQEETRQWTEEFQASLKTLDQSMKRQATSADPGTLVIHVTNGSDATDGWKVKVNSRPEETHRGKSAVLTGLYAGTHQVVLSGKISGKEVFAEAAAEVKAGGTSTVDVTLE